jgi:hypothetical protein
MYLGQVNIYRKALSRIKEMISQKYRREILSTELSNEIYELSKNSKKKNINIMDYGSGYNPILIDKIVKKILIRNKKIKIKVYCFDHYSKEQVKKLNKSSQFTFKNIRDLAIIKNKKIHVSLIIDVLHHVGLERKTMIKKMIHVIKKVSNFIIIKDHFQYGFLSTLLLIGMDFFSNFGDGTNIPKKYFSIKSFKKFVNENKLVEIKRIDNKKYYKWYWPIINSKKLQFISVLK